ncbi:hypothetical protein ABGN05_07695 [Aquibium sp. LZ166]|uniref:Uncharacterized protein n=1 Tax=Aquibium pacificus TaxID=3153579 RepID=A0ABV3SFM5_9HYPH
MSRQTIIEGFAVVMLLRDGSVPLSSKRFNAGQYRQTFLEAEHKLMDEALGFGNKVRPKATRERLAVAHFTKSGRKDATPFVDKLFPSPIVGLSPKEIEAKRAETWERVVESRSAPSRARPIASASDVEIPQRRPPGLDDPGG